MTKKYKIIFKINETKICLYVRGTLISVIKKITSKIIEDGKKGFYYMNITVKESDTLKKVLFVPKKDIQLIQKYFVF